MEEALEADRQLGKLDGEGPHWLAYKVDVTFADAPLTQSGEAEAMIARDRIVAWQEKPELIVCSPLTRAIQTAAIAFEAELASGDAQLVIRPELREYFADYVEQSGRTLCELRRCPKLHALAQWPVVEKALSDEATADWREQWDILWANAGVGSWQAHCSDPVRMEALRAWLSKRLEARIATVSHWGTINNFLNRQPWTEGLSREPFPWPHERNEWPAGGLVRMFDIPNCGWIAARMSPAVKSC